jgi:hypothetical protein
LVPFAEPGTGWISTRPFFIGWKLGSTGRVTALEFACANARQGIAAEAISVASSPFRITRERRFDGMGFIKPQTVALFRPELR